ncbi:efflux transporter outer membrane subunit [Vibrio fluvialis]|uniref:efflux transporter outer membrane subunit n=1 Tax=Vibrio fluvialis TaxID=676 RepID=UPI001EEB00B1|nr:efflux transporter outer membrane subunit [Vibrio fluvialis]MCG6403267.1 efflux transporter outer membrane subunit [Vibrio fluvialis]
MKLSFLSLSCTLIITGCSLAPEYQTPSVDTLYNVVDTKNASQKPAVDLSWKSAFTEPRLQLLISLALENNKDLRLATLNVAAAKAQYGIQRSYRLPSLDATISGTRQRGENDIGGVSTTSEYGAGLGISAFEIDLFGYARSMSEAAFYRYLVTKQGKKSAELVLISAVADAYHAQLLAKEQLSLSQQTLVDWENSLELARQLKAAEQSSALDVAQAEGQVATAEADLQARQRSLALSNHALQLLLGQSLPEDLSEPSTLENQPLQVMPKNLTSELIFNRPDIIQAELNLKAANADIGAARAAFFPRISLTASTGYSSQDVKNLFDGESRVWSFSPQISIPLFNAGKLKSELRLAEIRKSSAIISYEQAVQTAFKEVADGLSGLETFGLQIKAQERAVNSASKRAELSLLRYRAGVDDRLELLDAQRQLYAERQVLIDLKGAELANYVALYKALGGSFLNNTQTVGY